MRQSHTAVVARNAAWDGPFATEPWETAWAAEAIYFVRLLHPAPFPVHMQCIADISPDGIHWAELSRRAFGLDRENPLGYMQLNHFGGWLRLSGQVSCAPEFRDRLGELRFMAYLALKS